jgi:carbamoyl-phosphate synthase large subunit
VSLVNSNPATIMTDPEFADATYVEPITAEFVEKVIVAERDAGHPSPRSWPPWRADRAEHRHRAARLRRAGAARRRADRRRRRGHPAREDRLKFKEIVQAGRRRRAAQRGLPLHGRGARRRSPSWACPSVIRPSFTMGGLGSGMAHTDEDLERLAGGGLAASPVTEVLIEESVLGWKEYELELMRDLSDNVVVICSIENIDPMGVHTGDSITVAPAMTLTDREYQHMRDVGHRRAARRRRRDRRLQHPVRGHPDTGRLVVIEMNPRVSRSSALASKATGFPIAKIAAKLAVGYTLDEIPNDITGETPGASSRRWTTSR